jgi:hypothetical protein
MSTLKVKDSMQRSMEENGTMPIGLDDDFPTWPLKVDDELDNMSVNWLSERVYMDQDSVELPLADRQGEICEEEDGISIIATIENDWFVRLAVDRFLNC